MRKNILLLISLYLSALVYAQAEKMPQAISYQAIARDDAGQILANKKIGIKVEILKGSTSGTSIFSEIHSPESNATGTISLMIGQGSSSTGNFSDIDWGTDTYFLRLNMDSKGGSSYKVASTTQILPAPFALYAAKAGSAENGGNGGLAKYVIVSLRGEGDIYDILAGRELPESYELYFNFSIVYLDGIDQHLDVDITGLPADIIKDLNKTASGPEGRRFEYSYESRQEGTYDLSLVIKDKNGETIKEYPFKFKFTKPDYN